MNDSTLTFDKLRTSVLSEFPEIREWARKRNGADYDLDEEEEYPLFGLVIREFLFELLERAGNESLLFRLFDFFERMARSTDGDVRDLLGIQILELLVYDREKLAPARSYLGPKLRELIIEEGRRQGKVPELPEQTT